MTKVKSEKVNASLFRCGIRRGPLSAAADQAIATRGGGGSREPRLLHADQATFARHVRSVPGGKTRPRSRNGPLLALAAKSVLLQGSKIDPPQHVIKREQRRRAITAFPITSEDADLDATDGLAIACCEAGG